MAMPPADAFAPYHNFVPRSVLREFAHPCRPPVGPSLWGKTQKGCPGELMLNVVNTEGDAARVIEIPIGKSLGIIDMYRDLQGSSDQRGIEEKLSKLESRANLVMTKIREKYDAGKRQVRLTFPEQSDLRYFHIDSGEYSPQDRWKLSAHMSDKGFKHPSQVWFNNINAMLDVNVDSEKRSPDCKWLVENSYDDAARWFCAHYDAMHIAICTPCDSEDEFILTENSYNIHEGPSSGSYYDSITREIRIQPGTTSHTFAVLSPNLVIVLRNKTFSESEEEPDQEEDLGKIRAAEFKYSRLTPSLLEHLLVTREKEIINTIFVSLSKYGCDLEVPMVEKIPNQEWFSYFTLPRLFTDRLNFVMLENATSISSIIFDTRPALIRTLTQYLTASCEVDGQTSLKIVQDSPRDKRLKFLNKLERLAKDLNIEVTPVYQKAKLKPNEDSPSDGLATIFVFPLGEQ